MRLLRKARKIVSVFHRKMIQKSIYLGTDKYMRRYVKFLRKNGMDIEGMPNYISNDVHFDGKDYSIIHLGDGCTISREVHFLTHDYSQHTVFRGLRLALDEHTREMLETKDKNDKLLDLRGIHVGNNTFVGARALLLPGTWIGDNCIVGAGAVVKGTFENNTILLGNPAKVHALKTNEWLEKKAVELSNKGVNRHD